MYRIIDNKLLERLIKLNGNCKEIMHICLQSSAMEAKACLWNSLD